LKATERFFALCVRAYAAWARPNGLLLHPQNNIDGLYSLGYGTSTGFAIDPIQKKLLYHLLPGLPSGVDPQLMARDSRESTRITAAVHAAETFPAAFFSTLHRQDRRSGPTGCVSLTSSAPPWRKI